MLLLALVTVAVASPLVPRGVAVSNVGMSTSNIYPNPTATYASALFPDSNQLGHQGTKETGVAAFAVQTAPSFPIRNNIYPLVVPAAMKSDNTMNPVDRLPLSNSAPFQPAFSWGNLSPSRSVPSSQYNESATATPLIPAQCKLTQVHQLFRHGARYPTAGESPAVFAALLVKLNKNGGFNTSGPLDFLSSFEYKLGEEILTPFGRQADFLLGSTSRILYGALLDGFNKLLVIRSTTNARMVQTIANYAAGFFGLPNNAEEKLYELELQIESPGNFNSTLAPYYRCPQAFKSFGTLTIPFIESAFKDPAARLSKFISGYTFTSTDVYAMLNLCAYETVGIGYSAFCPLFTQEDFENFEYVIDLEFYYAAGFGSPAGAALGVGYLEEFFSRLTKTPIAAYNSSTNSTLDGDETTFPLDQPLYLDATHDIVIAYVLTALNLTSMTSGPLPLNSRPSTPNKYVVSNIAPFASSLIVQVMTCSDRPEPALRYILNDAVIPISYAGCEGDADGLCGMSTVVETLRNRIEEIDFEHDCFGNYTVKLGADINGRAPRN